MWLIYCRGDHSQVRMTAMLSTLSPDLAPISSSSHFYMAALNQRESEEDEEEGSHPPNGNGHFETDPGKWAVPQ